MEAREGGWEGADPGAEIRGEREIGMVEKEDEGSVPPVRKRSSPIRQDRIHLQKSRVDVQHMITQHCWWNCSVGQMKGLLTVVDM